MNHTLCWIWSCMAFIWPFSQTINSIQKVFSERVNYFATYLDTVNLDFHPVGTWQLNRRDKETCCLGPVWTWASSATFNDGCLHMNLHWLSFKCSMSDYGTRMVSVKSLFHYFQIIPSLLPWCSQHKYFSINIRQRSSGLPQAKPRQPTVCDLTSKWDTAVVPQNQEHPWSTVCLHLCILSLGLTTVRKTLEHRIDLHKFQQKCKLSCRSWWIP